MNAERGSSGSEFESDQSTDFYPDKEQEKTIEGAINEALPIDKFNGLASEDQERLNQAKANIQQLMRLVTDKADVYLQWADENQLNEIRAQVESSDLAETPEGSQLIGLIRGYYFGRDRTFKRIGEMTVNEVAKKLGE